MKILFLDAYFPPESIAFSRLEKDLCESLIAAGHEIEVICPIPSRGVSDEVRAAYKKKRRESLYDGKLQVTRFWAPREGKNPLLRAFRYFWCYLRQGRLGKRCRGIDAVFAASTPPIQGLLAGKVSRRLGCRFVYSLQDIFPDSLVSTGLSKRGSLLWKIGRRIEDKTYRRADKILTIGPSFRRNLLEKGVPAAKIEVVPNWIDMASVRPIPRAENPLFDEFGLDRSCFTVLYAGNFGQAQGGEIILEAAALLQDEPQIRFVLFGGGSCFTDIQKRAASLANAFVHPLLPPDRISEVYSLGDLSLITCKPGTGQSSMPSKTMSIMACNSKILATFDEESDLAATLTASGAGRCVPPGDAAALAEAIRAEYRANLEGEKGARDLRDWIRDHASRELCTSRYIAALTEPLTE